jgi:predicted alpha/beta-hydrolase family hydrolase
MQTWSQTVLASEKMSFVVPQAGAVSGLLMRPADSKWMLALAHGAGAGMTHPFMGALAEELASFGVATLRYQFPYMEGRKGRPDSPAMAAATVAAAVSTAADAAPDLPLLAGGKSFGGRMTSTAAAERLLHGVRGLVFFGFPLHPPKRPGTKRAEHLENVKMPMLFLQGTRDDLADLSLLQPICKKLAALATLHIIEGADHSFHVLKKSGSTDAGVLKELASATAAWAEKNAAAR